MPLRYVTVVLFLAATAVTVSGQEVVLGSGFVATPERSFAPQSEGAVGFTLQGSIVPNNSGAVAFAAGFDNGPRPGELPIIATRIDVQGVPQLPAITLAGGAAREAPSAAKTPSGYMVAFRTEQSTVVLTVSDDLQVRATQVVDDSRSVALDCNSIGCLLATFNYESLDALLLSHDGSVFKRIHVDAASIRKVDVVASDHGYFIAWRTSGTYTVPAITRAAAIDNDGAVTSRTVPDVETFAAGRSSGGFVFIWAAGKQVLASKITETGVSSEQRVVANYQYTDQIAEVAVGWNGTEHLFTTSYSPVLIGSVIPNPLRPYDLYGTRTNGSLEAIDAVPFRISLAGAFNFDGQIAAVGRTFAVAWTHESGYGGGRVAVIGGADGSINKLGGFALTRGPVSQFATTVISTAANDLVVWTEVAADITTIKAMRIDGHGVALDKTPLEISHYAPRFEVTHPGPVSAASDGQNYLFIRPEIISSPDFGSQTLGELLDGRDGTVKEFIVMDDALPLSRLAWSGSTYELVVAGVEGTLLLRIAPDGSVTTSTTIPFLGSSPVSLAANSSATVIAAKDEKNQLRIIIVDRSGNVTERTGDPITSTPAIAAREDGFLIFPPLIRLSASGEVVYALDATRVGRIVPLRSDWLIFSGGSIFRVFDSTHQVAVLTESSDYASRIVSISRSADGDFVALLSREIPVWPRNLFTITEIRELQPRRRGVAH